MKNLFVLFALVLTTNIFGQTNFGQITLASPFLQTNDTLVISGIAPEEVKFEIAEVASQVQVSTSIRIINEKEFTEEQNLLLIQKIAIAEAIEENAQIVSKLEKFKNKNVQIGGKTPIIERTVVLTLKKNTTVIYAN
jgi:hypothetical protein